MERRTALYQRHVDQGGKMVPFAGYSMPIQYPGGVVAEHLAVRNAAGLFDVSHMGEVWVTGDQATALIEHLLCNEFLGMKDLDCRYSPMCNEQGGIVDDLLVYRFHEQKYLLVINASNREKDVEWMKAHNPMSAQLEDISDSMCELALQGPASMAIMEKLCDASVLPERYYTFSPQVNVGGVDCLVSRTGYTGEDGFELYCPPEYAPGLWDMLLEAGTEEGLVPCGLGARDTLRLEAAMPLYGHEMNDDTTPFESALSFFVKMNKPDFVGRQALETKTKPDRKRCCIRMTGRGIAREGCPVLRDGKPIGVVTSGTHLPFVGYAGAMVLIEIESCAVGTELTVDVRGRLIEAQVVPTPFYKRKKI